MPNDLMEYNQKKPLLAKKPKANRGLMDFFRPAVDTVAAMDPTDTLLKLLSGVQSVPNQPTASPEDYNYIPSAPELGDPLTEMMNRQTKVKSTFGKIPGR
jgi:hypothetical protein